MRLSAILLICLLVGVFACKDQELPPGFEMSYRQQFEIPPGIGVFDVHHFYLKNIPTRYEQQLTQQGKKDADITGVVTAEATLSGLFGDANLDFIQQISVRVYKESAPNDYVEIAYRDPAPLDPGNNMGLVPSLADYKRLVTDSRFSVDVVLWLRRTTTESTPVQLDLKLRALF